MCFTPTEYMKADVMKENTKTFMLRKCGNSFEAIKWSLDLAVN